MKCRECDEEVRDLGRGTWQTLVGYSSPPGHNHDDNCLHSTYGCVNGHEQEVYLRRSCPNPECDWRGKATCGCHPGEKVEEWP